MPIKNIVYLDGNYKSFKYFLTGKYEDNDGQGRDGDNNYISPKNRQKQESNVFRSGDMNSTDYIKEND